MHIDHISISRESTWETCKYRYRYRYHLKTPSPVAEKMYFTYGKIVHKIIEVYTKNRGKINIADISKGVIETEPALPFYYRQQLNDDLSQFMLLTKKIGTGGDIEIHFSKDLDPPNKKNIVGVIDRLIERKGNYYIIDFKTTKRGQYQKTEESILGDLQLQCYSFAVHDKFNIPANKIKAALYYLQGGTLVSAAFGQKTIEETPKRLLKIYNEIMNADPDKVSGTVGEHCKHCEYNTICPFVKGTEFFQL